MTTLMALWLPILLSAVFVFVASSVLHMVLPFHRSDYRKMPDEDGVLDRLRGVVPAGQYMFPCAGSMKEMSTPEMMEKMNRGPVGILIVRPSGGFGMGTCLVQWFVFCAVISVFVAYLTGLAAPAGAEGHRVFRVAATVAVLGYSFSSVSDSIWKSVSWATTGKFVIDGAVYALVTAAVFAWLWPAAA